MVNLSKIENSTGSSMLSHGVYIYSRKALLGIPVAAMCGRREGGGSRKDLGLFSNKYVSVQNHFLLGQKEGAVCSEA